jgi:hypothetical protein
MSIKIIYNWSKKIAWLLLISPTNNYAQTGKKKNTTELGASEQHRGEKNN